MQIVTKYIVFLLLLLLSVQISFSQVTGSYTINSEGTSPRILTVKKHSQGYFLAGTTDGLYRFDGSSFKAVDLDTAIKNKSITAIAEDKSGIVWVGFQDGAIGLIKNKKVELLQAEEGHPAVAITSILTDTAGTVYFTTAGEGVYYYINKRFYNINTDDGLSDNYVYKIYASEAGLIACTDRGLNLIHVTKGKKEIKSFTSANSALPDNIVRCLYILNSGKSNTKFERSWIGMQDKGIGFYSSSGQNLQNFDYLKRWSYGQVNSIISTGSQLWIATEEKGIVVVQYADRSMTRVTGITNVNSTYGKADNLIADDEGNVWFTSNQQLIKTNGARLQNVLPFGEDVFQQVHTILEDHLKNLWMNVNGGLKKMYYDTLKGRYNYSYYALPEADNKTDITSLYEDEFGNIWVGTMGKGIIVIDPVTGKHRSISEDHLLINGSVLSVSGKGNEVWISSLAGAVHCNLVEENKDISKPYRFLNFTDVSSIGSNYVYGIFVDSKNRVWFATDGKGITVYEKGRFRNYSGEDGIKSNVIYNVCEDKNGSIWFSALNNGLYKFDGRKFINVSVAQGLNDATVTALATDERNNIIAITKKGVNIINASTNSISYLDANQGLNNLNTDLNCITGTASLYFVSDKGVMQYVPTEQTLQPKIVLESVQLFFNEIDPAKAGSFSYDENNFNFSYSGISYSHPDKIRYQYKIDGLSNEWITTKDNSINIPKFPPGKYTFHARASINNQFEGSNEVTYSFVIQKPFWFQWWFIALVLIALFSLVYLYIKAREKGVKRWERMEKEKIQSQFETLKSQVNPHFLFNSFNTLISVIEDDPQTAVQYVEHLSDLFRKIVTYRNKDVITLREEIEISNDYFYIQKKRFGESLQFLNSISDSDLQGFMIAPLTLQLLTENAVKHNAISSETPLVIEISISGKYLVVTNNLNPKISPEKGEGMGLQNIQKRYSLLSAEEVMINKTNTHFIVKIPLLTSHK